MIRRLFRRLTGRGREDDSDDSFFLRSRQDAEVLSSHGAYTTLDPNDEIEDIESQAEELQAQLPDEHRR